jgi:hypothetical protein
MKPGAKTVVNMFCGWLDAGGNDASKDKSNRKDGKKGKTCERELSRGD